MAAKNDITGDNIKTGSASSAYRDGWDRIFGKKEDTEDAREDLLDCNDKQEDE